MMKINKIIQLLVISSVLVLNLFFSRQPDEYIIKGVLLEKISTFIDWPDNNDHEVKEKKFVIGIMGDHKFGNILKNLYSKRKIQDKVVIVKNINSNSEINECRIIYTPKLSEEKLKEFLEFVRKKPILTISDNEGYASKGIHVNFYTEENNIRFEINERSIKESGISVNHLLLSLAKIVELER